MATHHLVTADELGRMGHQDFGYELVRGELVPVSPPGEEQGRLATHIAARLFDFVVARQLGTVYVETGYVLSRNPDTVRGPDVSFLSAERSAAVRGRVGFVPFAPDLAVEIRSPSNTLAEVSAKAQEYLDAGARLVWVVDPVSQALWIHQAGREPAPVSKGSWLEGGAVLPGFDLSLAELFAAE